MWSLFGRSQNRISWPMILPPISFLADKVTGQGEDGPPIFMLSLTPIAAAIGVFDGLGGSGARKIEFAPGDVRSEAAIASHLASVVSFETLKSYGFLEADGAAGPADSKSKIDINRLKDSLESNLRTAFADISQQLDSPTRSGLRGTISKRLPTTACILVATGASDGHDVNLNVMWAGDSRAYVWTPSDGLQQITRDHTKHEIDALQAIFDDPPMNRFISPDIDFEIDFHQIVVTGPCVLFCGTDGSFNYFSSPIDFELALVSSIAEASSWAAVSRSLAETVGNVAQDDVSFAMCGIGFDWAELQQEAQKRARVLQIELRDVLEARKHLLNAEQNAASAIMERDNRLNELRAMTQSLWGGYRRAYESRLP